MEKYNLPFRDARFAWKDAFGQWRISPVRASIEERDWLSRHANDEGAIFIETPDDPWGWDGRILVEDGPFEDCGPFEPVATTIGWYRVKFASDTRDRDHAAVDKAAKREL